MKKEKFKLSGEYFCGNKASDYAIKNGFLDYMTLAKAFDAVSSDIISKTDKINQIKKEIIISMKMMDTTIKNVKESEEYKIAQAYNQGLRDAMAIFEREMKR